MLFSLTGASGAGKSTVLSRLEAVDWGVSVHCVEFDDPSMQWSRWADVEAGDPLWRAEIIDTDALTPHEVAASVESWVRRELTPHLTDH